MSLSYGPLGGACVHLCVDMQRMFAEDTGWRLDWLPRVMPAIKRLVEARPDRTVFTRFIPARDAREARGVWRRYYERWADLTLDRLDSKLLDLVADLAPFVPPAEIVDKRTYSPWVDTDLHAHLQQRGVDTVIVSSGETDVCVLATVLGAVDLGYRVVVAEDALCSASDNAHDAQMKVYHDRYSLQIETATVAEILAAWH